MARQCHCSLHLRDCQVLSALCFTCAWSRLGCWHVSPSAASCIHFFCPCSREQPIFTTRAHVFQIDPSTKKNWVPASKQAVTVSYFYDSTRNSYRIISVDGAKVGGWRDPVFLCGEVWDWQPWLSTYRAALNIVSILHFSYNPLWRLVVIIGKAQGTTLKVILPSFVDFISDEFDFRISEPRPSVQIESVARYLKQPPMLG